MSTWNLRRVACYGALLVFASGCSIKHLAVSRAGDALAAGGSSFSGDDDPELVKAAAPFSLKLMESLLAEVPTHRGLLCAASSGFTQYAYAFIQQDAEELENRDVGASVELRQRARRLYLRGRDYGLRGLEARHRGFRSELAKSPGAAVRRLDKRDVPLAYWAAASWGAAIAVLKNDAELIGDLPQVQALAERVLQLDEGYECGAVHSFLIGLVMAKPGKPEDKIKVARQHFRRAVELSERKQAAPFVSLAEAVTVEEQNRREFESLLQTALAVDVNARPEWRLSNLVMQRRARSLLAREDNLIDKPETPDPTP